MTQKRRIFDIPQEITECLLKQEIQPVEFCMLVFINAIEQKSEIGCFASLAFLSKSCGISERNAKRIATKLINKGLLVNKGFARVLQKDGKSTRCRVLVTKWNEVKLGFSKTPHDVNLAEKDKIVLDSESDNLSPNIIINYYYHNNKFFGCYDNNGICEKKKGKSQKMFIKKDNTENDNTPSNPFDLKCAKRLLSILHKNNIRRKYSIKKWSASFAALRTQDQVSKKRIVRVLIWYKEMFGKPYVHKVLSAESFRQKFYDMEAKIARDGWVPPFAITREAKEISAFIDYIGWPKGSKDKLPAAIQISLDNYKIFMDKLQSLIPKNGLANWIYNWLGGFGKHGFILYWFRSIHEKVRNWAKWDGNLERLAFHPSSASFQIIAKDKTREYDGRESDWDKLLTKLGYHDEH